MASPKPPRAIAAKIILEVLKGRSLTATLPNETRHLSPADKGFVQEICFGVCRHYFILEYIQSKLLDRPVSKKYPLAPILIKIGLYQLAFMRVPDHAAINETVAAVRNVNLSNLSGLINAVLRNFSRERDQFSLQSGEQNHWNHPQWMVDKLKQNWPDHWQTILLANDDRAPMTLRINRSKISVSAYLDLLSKQGIEAKATQWSDVGIMLLSPLEVTSLPGFEEGWVSVQDEAAQLCCSQLIPKDLSNSISVLDACAAPGGKTLALLESHPEIDLTALDVDANRLERISENLLRAGCKAKLIEADGIEVDKWWDGKQFDYILLDAPCSASGVIRRHPDIKLLRKETDLPHLANTQLTLLNALWPTLKPGGRLVYATCSVFPQENSRIIERFLPKHSNAILDPLTVPWANEALVGKQFFPTSSEQDGFFISRLRKSES
jgi:16S rRNA (cytosine967-C5)-methyltransferase